MSLWDFLQGEDFEDDIPDLISDVSYPQWEVIILDETKYKVLFFVQTRFINGYSHDILQQINLN